jgi:hypothetical protein
MMARTIAAEICFLDPESMELGATERVQQHGCEIEELPWRDIEGGDHRWIVARWEGRSERSCRR